jgi:hypothetical protein
MRSVCQYSVYAYTVMSKRNLSACILSTTLLLLEDMSVCISVYASAIKKSVYQYSVYASTVTIEGICLSVFCLQHFCYERVCLSVYLSMPLQ